MSDITMTDTDRAVNQTKGREIMGRIKKCPYCKKQINEDNIRCPECDDAWQAGHKQGEEEIKDNLREMFNALKNLVNRK